MNIETPQVKSPVSITTPEDLEIIVRTRGGVLLPEEIEAAQAVVSHDWHVVIFSQRDLTKRATVQPSTLRARHIHFEGQVAVARAAGFDYIEARVWASNKTRGKHSLLEATADCLNNHDYCNEVLSVAQSLKNNTMTSLQKWRETNGGDKFTGKETQDAPVTQVPVAMAVSKKPKTAKSYSVPLSVVNLPRVKILALAEILSAIHQYAIMSS